MGLKKMFIDHPASVGETYFKHAGRAIIMGFRMLEAGLVAFIHAIIPGFFTTKAGDIAIEVAEEISELRDASSDL